MKSKKASMNTRRRSKRRLLGVVTVGTVTIAAATALVAVRHIAPVTPSVAASPMDSEPSFLPTIANRAVGPFPAPDGMVWIPGGEFSMGAADAADMNEVGMSATR